MKTGEFKKEPSFNNINLTLIELNSICLSSEMKPWYIAKATTLSKQRMSHTEM
jgi:hypothetical protein